MNLIPLFIVLPLAAAFTIPMVSRKFIKFPDILGNLTTLALVFLSVSVIGKTGVYMIGGWRMPLGINMVLDGLSVLMLITINIVAFASTLYSVDYM